MFISAMKHFQTEVHWEFKWKAKSTSTFFATSALVLFLAFMYSYYRQNILRCLDLRYRLFSVKTHLTSVSLFFDSVKFNKLTDVGAQSLGASLRNCTKVKTLRWGALSCYFITHLYFFQFFMGFFFSYPVSSHFIIPGCGTSASPSVCLRDSFSRTAASYCTKMQYLSTSKWTVFIMHLMMYT